MTNEVSERIVVVVPAYNEEKIIHRTLYALIKQTVVPEAIVIVDNNSTDRTAAIVAEYQDRYPSLHLIHEKQKGTGYACRTGFTYAISVLGATIVMRTDADTVPDPQWVSVAKQYFAQHPRVQLLGGVMRPLRDEYYRWYDDLFWIIGEPIARLVQSILSLSCYWFVLASGGNMALRATAYTEVGGFAPGDILVFDEDRDLSQKMYARFGFQGMSYSYAMKVTTSMRRFRKIGYLGFFEYYRVENPALRLKKNGGNIDIR